MEQNTFVQRLGSEAIGTGFLVFVGAGSVPATLLILGNDTFTMAQLGMISFAFLAVVTAVVYSLGHVSGAHINPAVTVGLAASGQFAWKEVPAYLGAQVVGAIAGAYAIVLTLGEIAGEELGLGVTSFASEVPYARATFAEFIGTFLLVFVVFGAIDKRAPGGFAGLAIAFAVFAAIIVVGPVTGASINPARHFGPMLALETLGGSVQWSQIWAYLGGEFAGGILAGWAYFAVARNPEPVEERVAEIVR